MLFVPYAATQLRYHIVMHAQPDAVNLPPFAIAGLPRIVFGAGSLDQVPPLAAEYGHRLLLVTGGQTLRATPHWPRLTAALSAHNLSWQECRIDSEPSPQLIDEVVRQYRPHDIDVVVAVGGGSVLDAAKAIAGLLKPGNSVMDHLEGVGPELAYRGPATPFIAVPTTAGTGSEATKNAVLSVSGPKGYKKSFRHDLLVARYAVVDPELLASCPPALIAANGMDALTQLLESYVSTRANPFTDALALSGIAQARDGLLPWFEHNDAAARARMAYAALLSGITLAQVGLGSVHGLAAPLGAFFPIPHGVVCGTLVAEATAVNLRALEQRDPAGPALARYASVGRLLCEQPDLADAPARVALVETLGDWTERLRLPRLGHYGVGTADLPRVVANCRGSSMKTNPIVLTDDEVTALLVARL